MRMPSSNQAILKPAEVVVPVRRPSRKRLAAAFVIAALSDVLSF